MTWKERRNVTILLSIAAALFLALLIVFGIIYRQGREEVLAGAVASGLAEAGAPDDPSAYTGLRYYNGSSTLSFSLDEKGNWIWADGPDFPLQSDTVTAVVETLASLKFQQALAATESKEEYGLDEPAASITASSQESTQELVFGKTTTDGDSYYMMMNGDESTVYIVADTLVKLIQTPIYDMCALPEFPDLSELRLRAVTVQGPAPAQPEETGGDGSDEPAAEPERPAVSLNARRSNGNEQPALWFSGNENVTANTLFQDLLSDLKSMSAAKCVDYFPSNEAAEICGFANPDATLKVEYTTPSGDETFTLDVGARMPDESGRYVRIDGGDAIYAMGTDHLDAVMSIAASGSLSGSGE